MSLSVPSDQPLSLKGDAILAAHRAVRRRRFGILIAMAVACLFGFLLDLRTGPSALATQEIWLALTNPDALSPAQQAIIWQVRFPFSLIALLVGAALALAGAEMQTILNNSMASPFTLGVSSAAGFGASLAIVLGLSLPFVSAGWGVDAMVSLNAFIFAFGAMMLLQAVTKLRGAGAEVLVLFGIALVFAFNAATSFVQFVSSQEALQQLVFWTMGSLSRATWSNVAVLAVVLVIVTPFSLGAARALTALRLGEDRAQSFGVDVARLRLLSLLRVSLLAATAVAFVGAIGFIGLVGPHIARLLLGEDHQFLLPGSMLTGAFIMTLASALSKSLVPGVLMPVGIVTAMIGVPIFLVLIFRSSLKRA